MRRCLLVFCVVLLFASKAQGQDKEADDRYKRLEEKYARLRDSLTLLHPLIPAVSSVMIKESQVEVNLFNSILTANRYKDVDGQAQDLNFRETYFYSTLQVTYGLSPKSRVNVGLDLNTITGRIDPDKNSSMFKVFSGSGDGSLHATAVSSMAARVRWRPIRRNYNFTVQASFGIPFHISTAKQPILGQSQYYFLTQALYNLPLNKRLFLFAQYSAQYNFKRENAYASFYSPLTAYLGWFIPKRVILFALLNYVPIFSVQDNWSYRYTLEPGGGIQCQLSRAFLVNAYYTRDVSGKNYPDFSGYYLSLRYVTR